MSENICGGRKKMELPVWLRQILAFTERDFQSWTTYKTLVYTQIINIFVGVFSWGIGAKYLDKPVAEMYNTNYPSFLIVGIAVGNLIMPLVQGVNMSLNPWTLETILMANVSTTVFVIGNVMWTYIFSVLSFIPYLVIGILLFDVHLNPNIPAVIVAFTISAAILVGLALISTGIRIVTKSTDPITWLINILQNIFSGVAFPVLFLNTIFFPGASTISWFLPSTWVYDLCRMAMLSNPSLLDPAVLIHFLEGAIFAAVFLPIGYKVFTWGVNRSKKEGSLGWY